MKLEIDRWLSLLGLAVLLVVTSGVFEPHDESMRRLQCGAPLRIGYAVEAPYAFLNDHSEVTGKCPEVARQIARQLGWKIEWVQVSFNDLLPGLDSGRFDVVAAGMFITGERSADYAFSIRCEQVSYGLLVQRGNPLKLHSCEQAVADPSVRLAVLSGSVEESLLLKLGMNEERLLSVPDALTGRTAVEYGFADGLALSEPTIRWMAARDDLDLIDVASPFTPPSICGQPVHGDTAFVFRKQDRGLRSAWDGAMKQFIESPEHQVLTQRFGLRKRGCCSSKKKCRGSQL